MLVFLTGIIQSNGTKYGLSCTKTTLTLVNVIGDHLHMISILFSAQDTHLMTHLALHIYHNKRRTFSTRNKLCFLIFFFFWDTFFLKERRISVINLSNSFASFSFFVFVFIYFNFNFLFFGFYTLRLPIGNLFPISLAFTCFLVPEGGTVLFS